MELNKIMTNTSLEKFFRKLEAKIEPLDELDLAEKIKALLIKDGNEIANKYDQAEYCAFFFFINESAAQTGYYGPIMSGTKKDGQVVQFPNPSFVDADVIEYWKERANISVHPILSCRYADLVVDFEQRINSGTFDYLMVQKVIDSTIQICKKGLSDGLECKQKLKRALYLTKLIHDNQRLITLRQIVIDTEARFAEDNKPGLWGYAFEWLLLQSKPYSTSKKQQVHILNDMEKRLDRLTKEVNSSPWNVECAALLLARYYNSKNEITKLEKILHQLEEVYRKNTYSNSDGLLVVNYLEKFLDIYGLYSKYDFAKNAMGRIRAEMSNISSHTKFNMEKISVDMEISKDDIRKILDNIFGKGRKNTMTKVRDNMILTFIPRKDQVETELKQLGSKYVYLNLGNQSVISDDGFSIAKFGPINEDFDRHLLQHFSQNLHFQSMFLHLAFEELKKISTPSKMREVLLKSPVFRPEDREYLMKVLSDFWDGNYLSSSCLMIPLIEDAIRNIYRLNHLSFIRSNSDGGYDVESLNLLLERGVISKIYGLFGEPMEFYLRVVLTERLGWNLRNNFAHGINKNHFKRVDIAERLLHILFCLSLIRVNKQAPKKQTVTKNND